MSTTDDPYFVVRDEVQKALSKAQHLHQRWLYLTTAAADEHQDELEWTGNELKNAVRSIEWDLEDLEETISIVEKNPRKFRIDEAEVRLRRAFVEETRRTADLMKEQLANPSRLTAAAGAVSTPAAGGGAGGRYTRLDNDAERSNDRFLQDMHSQQQQLMRQQDQQLDTLGNSIGSLKGMSRAIGNELDEQSTMLDEFGREMEQTESKLDSTMKKMARVMHMSNDRRQWVAIGVLVAILLVVVVLLITL